MGADFFAGDFIADILLAGGSKCGLIAEILLLGGSTGGLVADILLVGGSNGGLTADIFLVGDSTTGGLMADILLTGGSTVGFTADTLLPVDSTASFFPSSGVIFLNVIRDGGALLSGDLLGRGSLGESAILLMGAGSCLLTATEVWGAVTVLKVAIEDLEGELLNN